MKNYFGTIILSALLLSAVIAFVQMNSDLSFQKTLAIDPQNVTKIVMEDPHEGTSRTTADPNKIAAFMAHLGALRYKHLSADESAYMPMRARIIYIYEGERSDFLVPYAHEVMISKRVYHVQGDGITEGFLDNFYDELKEAQEDGQS